MSSVQNTTQVTQNTENRGKRVLANMFGGVTAERVVWEEDGDTVYLCSEKCYKQLLDGNGENQPIGFSRSDIDWNES